MRCATVELAPCISIHRETVESWGSMQKVPGHLMGLVILGLHAHNHERQGDLSPVHYHRVEALIIGGAAGKQLPYGIRTPRK